METQRARPGNVLPLPRWTIIIHGVQMLLAVIILGLDAYGIRWIPYNALIFSLVAALITLGICLYIIVTTLFLHNLYNAYIVAGLHLLMMLFWIVDMGLVANLARIWSSPSCSYSYLYGYYCYYGKRDLSGLVARDTTSTGSYYGALAAGAFFGALQFALWVLSAIFVAIYLNKQRSNHTTSSHGAPAYAAGNDQAVPMDQKYNQTGQAEAQPLYQQPQQSYPAVSTPQSQYAQPVPPQGQYGQQPVYNQQQQFTAPYAQDPVNRAQTVSPVSSAGYGGPPQDSRELATPQHAANYSYNPNASELSSPQSTGNHGHNPTASELSSSQHIGGYDPNTPELSNQK